MSAQPPLPSLAAQEPQEPDALISLHYSREALPKPSTKSLGAMHRKAGFTLVLLVFSLIGGIILLWGAAGASSAWAQRDRLSEESGRARAELKRALADARNAENRGKKLEAEARQATEAAERTAREAAALAARIQQAEAGIEASEAKLAIISTQRGQLIRHLAERREPLVRLTAALQKLARRPLALAALRPGSVRETVYLRAILESTIPQIRRRTASLRAEIARARKLEREAGDARDVLRESEGDLIQRRRRLAGIESRQRLTSRRAQGTADRESERALALGEEARDLDTLVEELENAGSLRKELAALSGPILRPSNPQRAVTPAKNQGPNGRDSNGSAAKNLVSSIAIQLPVDGALIAGFGEAGEGGVREAGLSLRPREGAQVVGPAGGRVVFAGPYRGYGRIVILEHDGGWTSLVTGLARIDVEVGDTLVKGAPLGVAAQQRPKVALELRRGTRPVNPLDYLD